MNVENGDGLENANSYVSVDYADNYFSLRGFSVWSGKTTTEKETALINATDFVDNAFKWKGKKETQEQNLNFPRVDLYNDYGEIVEGIPRLLKDAVCEASRLLIKNKSLFQVASENGNVTSEKIGELAFTYDGVKKIDSSLYDSINTRLRGLYVDTTKKKIISAEIRRKL